MDIDNPTVRSRLDALAAMGQMYGFEIGGYLGCDSEPVATRHTAPLCGRPNERAVARRRAAAKAARRQRHRSR